VSGSVGPSIYDKTAKTQKPLKWLHIATHAWLNDHPIDLKSAHVKKAKEKVAFSNENG